MSGNGHNSDPKDGRPSDDADYWHCECDCDEFNVVRWDDGTTMLRCANCGLYHDPKFLGGGE